MKLTAQQREDLLITSLTVRNVALLIAVIMVIGALLYAVLAPLPERAVAHGKMGGIPTMIVTPSKIERGQEP